MPSTFQLILHLSTTDLGNKLLWVSSDSSHMPTTLLWGTITVYTIVAQVPVLLGNSWGCTIKMEARAIVVARLLINVFIHG